MENYLYYGDNLEVMKKLLEEKSSFIDLVYIDPPFNSKRNYNILYKDRFNELDDIQKEVFTDTWSNVDYQKNIEEIKTLALNTIDGYLTFIKKTMPISYISYLSMMAIRIYYIRELLKETGSFYLHCDPTMSHYLKTLCDLIFGVKNFKNEIIWKRTYAHNDPKKFGRNRDSIFFYTKSNNYIFHIGYEKYSQEYIENNFTHKDKRGKYQSVILTGAGINKNDKIWKDYHPSQSNRSWSIPKRIINKLVGEEKAKTMSIIERLDLLYENDYILISKNGIPRFKEYLDEMIGVPFQEIWTDINPISSNSNERVEGNYPTQKPIKLLNRIIEASSKEGDLVADFFCGCGTTIDSAIENKRNFVGCDISTLSIAVVEKRLRERNRFLKNRDFEVEGLPKNFEQALKLAEEDKYKFQDWAIEYLLNAVSNSKKTGDGGIDGNFYFQIPPETESKRCIIDVKGGKNLSITQVRSFIKTCQENNCAGILLTMENITDGMKTECHELGTINKDVYKCDIVSIKNVMEGKRPIILEYNITYKKAKQVAQKL